MINIEFESVEEIKETLTIVSDSINEALNRNSNWRNNTSYKYEL